MNEDMTQAVPSVDTSLAIAEQWLGKAQRPDSGDAVPEVAHHIAAALELCELARKQLSKMSEEE